MARGRPAKPTNLKILQGNPGKRPLPKDEPKPPAFEIIPPDHLDDDARAEWARIVPVLLEMRILTEADKTALAIYCAAYGKWVQSERAIQSNGLIVFSQKGAPVRSPHLAIARESLATITKMLSEFGLTPASRTKVKAEAEPEADEFEKLMAR